MRLELTNIVQPKATKQRKGAHAHDQSVRLPSKLQEEIPVPVEIVAEVESPAEPRLAPNKKERQQLKREAFREHLESTHSPYSKSHDRRMKRKAKEQIASGLSDIQAVLASMDPDPDPVSATDGAVDTMEEAPKPKPKLGQIGEGKAATLTKNQRKRALEMERLRHPLILSNPSYSSNPFATIRTHAQNTLLKHERPT